MPCAHRLFLPIYVWHITHRCHRKDFLPKFAKDRTRWLYWLFEAKKRFGLYALGVDLNTLSVLCRSDPVRIGKTSAITLDVI